MSSGRVFVPQVDGLRFVAIMAVLAYHVRSIGSYHLHATPAGTAVEGDVVNNLFSTGHLGVELFFAISGFILSLPFARWRLAGEKPVSLRAYYIRRVSRIEPPYVIHLALLFFYCAFILRFQSMHQHYFVGTGWFNYSVSHLLASLLYVNSFVYGTHPYPNIVLWSLAVEVQFYLLAPLLARVFQITGTWLRRGLILSAIVFTPALVGHVGGWLGGSHIYWLGSSVLGNLQFFLVGFLLADWYATLTAPPPRNYYWDLAAILGVVTVVVFRNSAWIYPALPFLIGLGCLAAFCGTVTFRILGIRWITTIGGMCYTIYMYHWLLISGLIRVTIKLSTHILWLDLLIQYIVLSAGIITISSVLFALFERPFMQRDWFQQFWTRGTAGKINRVKS